jgi:hypothetical protein
VDAAALDQWNGGSAPVRRATSTDLPGKADLDGMLLGPVRSKGVARCVIRNWSHVLTAPSERVGWTSGELPGQLAAWPSGPQTPPDQPPARA